MQFRVDTLVVSRSFSLQAWIKLKRSLSICSRSFFRSGRLYPVTTTFGNFSLQEKDIFQNEFTLCLGVVDLERLRDLAAVGGDGMRGDSAFLTRMLVSGFFSFSSKSNTSSSTTHFQH